MRRVLIVLLLLAGSLRAQQGACFTDSLVDSTGKPVRYPTIQVCKEPANGNPCVPLANVFSDQALAQALANPFTGDERGNIQFCAAQGTYHLQYSYRNVVTEKYWVAVTDATRLTLATQLVPFSVNPTFDSNAASLFTLTLTGNVTNSSITHGVNGRVIVLKLCQDTLGGHTFAWPTTVATPPNLPTDAASCSSYFLYYDGNRWRYWSAAAAPGSGVDPTAVHLAGDESIGGHKTFLEVITAPGLDLEGSAASYWDFLGTVSGFTRVQAPDTAGNNVVTWPLSSGTVALDEEVAHPDQVEIITKRWTFQQGVDFGGLIIPAQVTVTFSATPVFDAAEGASFTLSLTGDVTSSTLVNLSAGQSLDFLLCQDGVGGHTLAWPTNVKGGMVIGGTASKCSAQHFICTTDTCWATATGSTDM